jgi:hypothetical protein
MVPQPNPEADTASPQFQFVRKPANDARDDETHLGPGPLRDGVISFAKLLALAAVRSQRHADPANDC